MRQPHPTAPEEFEKRLQLAEAEILLLRAGLLASADWSSISVNGLTLRDKMLVAISGAKNERFLEHDRALAFEYVRDLLVECLEEGNEKDKNNEYH